MKSQDRILWSEGMFLRPQHFQQLELYFENKMLFLQHQKSNFWGISKIQIDKNLLEIGIIKISEVSGIFQDGTIFQVTNSSFQIDSVEIKSEHVGKVFFIAIPIQSSKEIVHKKEKNSFFRYSIEEKKIDDQNSYLSEKINMQFLSLKIRILSEDEINGNWLSIGILKIQDQNTAKKIFLEKDYVPPLLNYKTNEVLSIYHKSLMNLIKNKRRQFYSQIDFFEKIKENIKFFYFLSCLEKFLVFLEYLEDTEYIHPEKVFLKYKTFFSELSILKNFIFQEKKFFYQHSNIKDSFKNLIKEIKNLINFSVEKEVIELKIFKKSSRLSILQLPNLKEDLYKYRIFFSIKITSEKNALLQEFLLQTKISSIEKIHNLVKLQIPGFKIKKAKNVPKQILEESHSFYFVLENQKNFWKEIQNQNSFAVYFSEKFKKNLFKSWIIKNV